MQIFPSFSPPTGQNEFIAFCSLGGLKLGKICNSEIVYLKKSRISQTQQDFVKKKLLPPQKKNKSTPLNRPLPLTFRVWYRHCLTPRYLLLRADPLSLFRYRCIVSRTNITSQSGQGLRFGLRSKRNSDWLVIFVHEITYNPVHITETAIIHPPI